VRNTGWLDKSNLSCSICICIRRRRERAPSLMPAATSHSRVPFEICVFANTGLLYLSLPLSLSLSLSLSLCVCVSPSSHLHAHGDRPLNLARPSLPLSLAPQRIALQTSPTNACELLFQTNDARDMNSCAGLN